MAWGTGLAAETQGAGLTVGVRIKLLKRLHGQGP